MSIGTRKTDSFSFGPSATSSTVVLHDPLDLSRARSLKLNLTVTAAASAANDTLDVKFQDTIDGITWNTRARFAAVAGNQSVATQYVRELVITQDVKLNSGEREYQTSGSQGGTELPAGTVMDGTFYPPYRDATGRHANWRVVFTVTNNSGTASFTATLTLWSQDWAQA